MIEAVFDARRSREAAISGVYQYDTGQRIRVRGLPGPQEMGEMDELLSGDTVQVQVQYGYTGEEQSEPRFAEYDAAEDAWIAEVPNRYLTRADTVNVYVFVMYGETEESRRTKTMYHGAFIPIGRPAPNGEVTPDQLSAWDVLVREINLALSEMGEATSGANAAAQVAREAAEGANEAAQRAEDAAADALEAAERANAEAESLGSMTAEATTLEPGSEATATMTKDNDGNRTLTLGIPKGEKGDTGPAGVTFRLEDRILYIDTDEEV